MTDRGSEPKAPLRPMAPPFGGLRASRPLTRPTGTPSLGATPIAQRAVTPMFAPIAAPPRSATPFSTPSVDPAAPAPRSIDIEPAVVESSTDSLGGGKPMPGITDFLSYAEPDSADREALAMPRVDEADLAKSTHGDPLLQRTLPAVPETVAGDSGSYPIDDQLETSASFAANAQDSLVDPRDALADVDVDFDPSHFEPELQELEPSSALRRQETPESTVAWTDEPWPADPADEPVVSARPTPHDVAAVRGDDDDPFHWDSPNSYEPASTDAERNDIDLVAADARSNPFAALSEPPFAAGERTPPMASEIEPTDADQHAELSGVAESFGGGPATVYEPDDATSWAATAMTASGSAVISEGVGRHAASVLEHLAEDVRSGRLRIEGGENASAAGVLASLLATLLAPQRQG